METPQNNAGSAAAAPGGAQDKQAKLLESVFEAIWELDPMPTAAVELLDELADDNYEVSRCAAILDNDPRVAAEVMQVCSSAALGLAGRVKSPRDAVRLLGSQQLTSMLITLITGRYLTRQSTTVLAGQQSTWRQSLAGALASRRLLRHTRLSIPSRLAFKTTFLRDFGSIVLLEYPSWRASLRFEPLPGSADATNEAVLEHERKKAGLDHASVGALVAEQWNLDPAMVRAIQHHHTPLRAPESAQTLAAVVHVSDAIATQAGYVSTVHNTCHALDPRALERIGATRQMVARVAERLPGDMAQ